jgi:hypothetical protein
MRPDLIGGPQHPSSDLWSVRGSMRSMIACHHDPVRRPDAGFVLQNDELDAKLCNATVENPDRRSPLLGDRHAIFLDDAIRPARQTVT